MRIAFDETGFPEQRKTIIKERNNRMKFLTTMLLRHIFCADILSDKRNEVVICLR